MLTFTTVIFMIIILGTIWGGLIYFLNRAYRREKHTAGER